MASHLWTYSSDELLLPPHSVEEGTEEKRGSSVPVATTDSHPNAFRDVPDHALPTQPHPSTLTITSSNTPSKVPLSSDSPTSPPVLDRCGGDWVFLQDAVSPGVSVVDSDSACKYYDRAGDTAVVSEQCATTGNLGERDTKMEPGEATSNPHIGQDAFESDTASPLSSTGPECLVHSHTQGDLRTAKNDDILSPEISEHIKRDAMWVKFPAIKSKENGSTREDGENAKKVSEKMSGNKTDSREHEKDKSQKTKTEEKSKENQGKKSSLYKYADNLMVLTRHNTKLEAARSEGNTMRDALHKGTLLKRDELMFKTLEKGEDMAVDVVNEAAKMLGRERWQVVVIVSGLHMVVTVLMVVLMVDGLKAVNGKVMMV